VNLPGGYVKLLLGLVVFDWGSASKRNGMLLFGLTTAFLFAMIQRVWPLGSREWHRDP